MAGEDGEHVMALDGEQHIIAAFHHMVKALGGSKNLSSDIRKLIAELDNHLSITTGLQENEAGKLKEVEGKLKSAHEKILCLQSNHVRIWDAGPQEGPAYLEAIDEVLRLKDHIISLPSKQNSIEVEGLIAKADCLLQIAVARLQDELVHILKKNKQSFEHEYVLLFHSYEENILDEEESIISVEDDSVEDISRRASIGTEPEEYIVHLVHPDAVSSIKSIARTMFATHYDQEFCNDFSSFWNDALYEYLLILDMQQLSIEDVLLMDWESLSSRIKKWCRTMKNVVGFYLPNEKRLFDQVLGEFGSACSECLIEASKAPLLCLLNFGQAVAIGSQRPERLFCLLDMYEVVTELLQQVYTVFMDDSGHFIKMEFQELRKRLGDTAKTIFVKLGDIVASNPSTAPFLNGGVHHLTRYVMNYIKLLEAYPDTLNYLLKDKDWEESNQDIDAEVQKQISSESRSPLSCHLQSVTSSLEINLDSKSNLYRDASLKHIFMMNNIHYMVQKIKNSDIRNYFGDDWIKHHICKFQHHARDYERITWSPVLSLLRVEGKIGKAVCKQRCRSFNVCFEEVYKIQTGWFIPDLQLREDLRISISQKLSQAYRPFCGRIGTFICDRHIKYSAEDLEHYILDLFESSPKPLYHPRRK